jgi:hypothetical protein
MIYLFLVVYVVVIGLISYVSSDKGTQPLKVSAALWIAAWPLLIAAVPFLLIYLVVQEVRDRL